jgi:hypothetical protein
MESSGYTLDLYCDNIDDDAKHKHGYYDIDNGRKFPLSYFEDGPKCYEKVRKMAKEDGWKFLKDGGHLCPKCSGKESTSHKLPPGVTSISVWDLLAQKSKSPVTDTLKKL